MAALQLGDVENFPFLDPPDQRSIRDGVQLLQELGAFDRHGAITDAGAPARAAAARSADRPDDPAGRRRGLRARGAGARGGAVDPRPAGAARRPGGGRPAEARPLRRRALRLRLLPQPLALPRRAAKGAVRQLVSPDVPRGVPALPAHPRMAGPRRPAAQHRARHGDRRIGDRARRPGARARRADRRTAVARRAAGGRDPRVRRRAQLAVRPGARLGADQAAAALDRRRRPGRDQQAVRPDRRPHRTGGRRARRRAIWCSAPTANRTGMPDAAR